jgi:hypothetical protein
MMVFEFEGFPSVEKLLSVLESLGAYVKIEDPGFVGSFSESNAFFVYSKNSSLEEIATDQENPLGWEVGARLVVHCPIGALAESAKELDDFMDALVSAVDTRFLLSFQYESICAVRDRDLLVYKKIIE